MHLALKEVAYKLRVPLIKRAYQNSAAEILNRLPASINSYKCYDS